MSPTERFEGVEIGATLRDARRRIGLEVAEVEDRTKIRARYLRALENENWEALPGPTYVRGFIRAYAQVVGVDGEMLADAYRRRLGEESGPAGPAPPEPLLSERRRPDQRRPSRGWFLLAAVGLIVVLLVVLGTLGGDDDGGTTPERSSGAGNGKRTGSNAGGGNKQKQKKVDKQRKTERPPLEKETAQLSARTGVEVCLVAGSDTALIDGILLAAGTEESFDEAAKRYRLDLRTPGVVRFRVGGNSERLEVDRPASFEADSRGIRAVDYRGPDCP